MRGAIRAAAKSVYGVALLLFPESFRRRFAAEMAVTFSDALEDGEREGGAIGLLGAATRGIGNLVSNGIEARWEARRDHSMRRGIDTLRQDIHQARRRLSRHRGFTAIAVLTLALGIGATTAIFSVVNSVLLRPLPYADADELVFVRSHMPSVGATLFMTEGAFVVFSEQSETLASVGAFVRTSRNLAGGERPARVRGIRASHALLSTLGVTPAVGRGFFPEDDAAGAPPVVILGYSMWRRLFGQSPDVLGRTIRLDGESREVIGVTPSGFRFPDEEADFWVPLGVRVTAAGARNTSFHYRVVGRLSPGATREQAEAELLGLFDRAIETYGGSNAIRQMRPTLSILAVPLKERIVGSIGEVLWVVLAAVGLILVIACANVANLFLVQAEGREREVALRATIGANRRRLMRHMLSESVLLGLLGGLGGLAIAFAGTRWVVAVAPDTLPRVGEIGMDGRVLVFTAAISIVAGLAFGALPAFRVRLDGLGESLKDGGRTASGGRHRGRMRNGLVVSQLALALVLLAGSGLMLRTFWNLRAVDPGFRSQDLLTFQVRLPGSDYPSEEEQIGAQREILDRLARIPGAASVGASTSLPLDPEGSWFPSSVWVEGGSSLADEAPPLSWRRIVSPGFFETLEIPLLAGRSFEQRDIDVAGALIVSERFALDHWPDVRDAVGQRAKLVEDDDAPWYTIVGVVKDARETSLALESERGTVYWSLRGLPGTADRITGPGFLTYVIRPVGDPSALVPAVREVIAQVDPNLPLANVREVSQIVSRALAGTAFTMVLLAIAAVIAIVLGAVGIYGVLAHVVAARTREIGVRMALGAHRRRIFGMVLLQAGKVVVVGTLLGVAAAVAMTRVLDALLFGVTPVDVPTFGGVAILLAVVALLASYLPARRAAGVDPMEALRHE